MNGSATILSELLGRKLFPTMEYGSWFGIAVGFLDICGGVCPELRLRHNTRFKPFRSYGIIGYSAYLLHPLLIDVLGKLSVFYIGLDLTGVPLFVVK